VSAQERFDQPQRWIADGLESIGKGIAWAGFWIGLGIALSNAQNWMRLW
jgi:hypothetical protein